MNTDQVPSDDVIETRKKRTKKSLNTPTFYFLLTLTILVFFVPMCTYKHNLQKMKDRTLQELEVKKEKVKSQSETSEYVQDNSMPRMGR